MKKNLNSLMTAILAGTLVFGTVNVALAAPNNSNMPQFINQQNINKSSAPTVQLNGQQLNFDVSPQIDNGTTLVPVRAILEALGAQVQWDDATKTVTATKGQTNIKLTINQKKAYKNGSEVDLATAGKIVNGRTLIPLRFFSEALGAIVTWDQSTQTITIQYSDNSAATTTSTTSTSLSDINNSLNDYFEAAGEDYFGDDGIATTIRLSGDESDLAYTVKLDFSDASDYDNLTDVSETKLESLMSAVKSKISSETDGTDYADADITGKVIDNDDSSYYAEYDGSSYTFSWDDNETSLSDIKSELNDYFEAAGDDYFSDDGITTTVSLSGDESDLAYTVKLDFSDASDYDNLTDVSETELKSLMSAVKSKISSETDGTDYEDADITGKIVDNDHSSYYAEYDGSSYTFSWDDNGTSLSDIKSDLNDYFEAAGDDYFSDDGITTTVSLSGDEDDLAYTVKLDFSDASDYDNLTDVSETKLKSLMSAVKSKIEDETDSTDYEDAEITGKVVDSDDSSNYAEYDGSSYTFSWD